MPWWGLRSSESSPLGSSLPLLRSLDASRQCLGRCCSSVSALHVSGQERGAVDVTREGPGISGDMVCLLCAPFVPWHLTETWPLLKTAEWDAAADRKTAEGSQV